MAKNHNKFLHEYVREQIDDATFNLLKQDGRGLQFNREHGCQMTIIASGVSHRLYFNYNKMGGVLNCIKYAIAVYDHLKERAKQRNVNLKRHSKRGGVCYVAPKENSGGDYYHYVRYFHPIKQKFIKRAFVHGHVEPNAAQWLHGQHTAIMFRDMVNEAPPEKVDEVLEFFRQWKNRRVYVLDQPLINYKEL